MYPTDNEESLLEIELGLEQEPASQGQRFANYLIDAVLFYAVIFLLAILWAIVNPRQAAIYGEEVDNNILLNYVIGPILYAIFYTIVEGASGGRTLGKLITKTKVIKEDGSSFEWKDALLRSLSRIVPLEPFSGLGPRPWHDRWTQTKVVKIIK